MVLGSKKKKVNLVENNGWMYRGLIFLKRRVKIAIVDCSYVKFMRLREIIQAYYDMP